MDKIQVTKEHLAFCFRSLIAKIDNKPLPQYPKSLQDFKQPLFVTWYKGKQQRLRGCIGTFSFQPLSINLQNYALISALQDTRFQPIQKKEIPELTVSVSLLYDYQKNKKWNEWEVGTHGIIINFSDQGEHYQATYLPEVAQEQEWTIEEALESLIQKSGYYNNYKNVLERIELTTYKSEKQKMNFEQFLEYEKNQN